MVLFAYVQSYSPAVTTHMMTAPNHCIYCTVEMTVWRVSWCVTEKKDLQICKMISTQFSLSHKPLSLNTPICASDG